MNENLRHSDIPTQLSRNALSLVNRYTKLFQILDKYDNTRVIDPEFYQSLGLEKLFSQAALLQNENFQEQEKAKFLTALLTQYNRHKERKQLQNSSI